MDGKTFTLAEVAKILGTTTDRVRVEVGAMGLSGYTRFTGAQLSEVRRRLLKGNARRGGGGASSKRPAQLPAMARREER